MIKAIAFDFDGTLADTAEFLLKAVKEVGKEYGVNIKKSINTLKKMSAKDIVKNELKLKFYQFPGFKEKIKKIAGADIRNNAKLFKGMAKVWEELSHHYSVGIVTSNSEETVRNTLAKAGIENVDFVISEKSLFGKHRALRKMLRKLKLKSEEAIYVGDEIRDIDACKKTGIRMIAVSWGFNSKKALKKEEPTYLIDKPNEIIKILVPEKFVEFKQITST